MSDRKRKKSSVCKRKRESSVEAAILNYYSQDVSDSARNLKTALSKLRQMRLDIFMKLITDHNQAISADEELLRKQLDQRCPCTSKPLADCNCEPVQSPELVEVAESLANATSWIENTYCLIGSNGLNKRYERLYLSICDALHSAREAMERLEDQPDEE